VTSGGTGNGTIVAGYSENTGSQVRTATVSVTVASLPVQTVTVTQAKSPIGINEVQGNDLRIFPNPTTGVFRIVPANGDNNSLDVKVADISGKIILKTQFNGEKEYELNLSASPAGSYYITITSGKNLLVRKLVIIK
jgi:hypothetical protein